MYHREFIVLHHTGAEEEDAGHVKRNHLRKGFRDIGYNYLIEKDGRIVTGRPLDIPGAHCIADRMNFRSIGVALIGNFEERHPFPEQINSLIILLQELQIKHSISLESILLHKEVKGTATKCPGKLFPWDDVRLSLYPDVPWMWQIKLGTYFDKNIALNTAQALRDMGYPAVVERINMENQVKNALTTNICSFYN
ncbi:MAG: N-acetylmuramoyl-L-alanine amidase [Clostridia bacterium]|jgi:N-acetyl-anhydromuramyl-L-alanine amidase AmpD|nr:N-acetylmuramoyl-L-alanine amidase [Clostridia bacterium]